MQKKIIQDVISLQIIRVYLKNYCDKKLIYGVTSSVEGYCFFAGHFNKNRQAVNLQHTEQNREINIIENPVLMEKLE